MKVSKILEALTTGYQTLSAALSSGELSMEDDIGFGINNAGEVLLTKGGEVLAICKASADKEAVKKWADALLKDIEDKRAGEEKVIREAVIKARKALEKAEKTISDKEAKIKAESEKSSEAPETSDDEIEGDDEMEDEDEAKTSKKPVKKSSSPSKTVITDYDRKEVEGAKEDLEKAEAALRRLDETGLVSEKIEASIKAAKVMADVFIAYFEKACTEEAFAKAAMLKHKTLPRLVKYIYDKTMEIAGDGKACCVPANEVYSWIRDYMLLDDKEACEKEEAEERERELKRKNSSAIESVKAARRTATSKRKDANAKKAEAEKEADADKKASLLAEYEKLSKKADELKANADKLYEDLSDEAKELMKNEGKKAEKKESKSAKKSKEENEASETNIFDIASAKATKVAKATGSETAQKAVKAAKKVEKAIEPADELPPMQMSIFDLLGA